MFFEPTSYSEKSLDMDTVREWAGAIANSYLNGGVPPTDSLTKMAQNEELTPHQIEVLAGETNKEIHRHKYAAAKDKYFAADFPLADAKVALNKLQADGGGYKVAATMPEPVFASKELDLYKAFGIEEKAMDKTASVKPLLKAAAIGCGRVAEAVKDKAILSKYAADAAAEKFIKTARQFVIQNDNAADRMKALGNLDSFVKAAGMPEGRTLLAKVAYVVGKEGLITPNQMKTALDHFTKEADVIAPEELISDWLPAQIVNGEHPLYITLKTHCGLKRSFQEQRSRSKLVEDRLGVIHQKIRAL